MASLSAKKDRALEARYRHLLTNGFQQHTYYDLMKYFTTVEIKVKPKSDDISGLQMADLLAAICFHVCHARYGRVVRGLTGLSKRVGDLIEAEKFYRHDQKGPHGFGRVWRPQ